MFASSTLSTLPLFFLLLLLPITNATIDETCKAASASHYLVDYDICTTSLQANPNSETANPKDLALIGAQLCLNNATSTVTKTNDMIKNGNFSLRAKEILKKCANEVFNDEIYWLSDAIDWLKKGSYTDALDDIGEVRAMAYDCDDLFDEKGEYDPLKEEQVDMDDLSNLALFLVDRLRG
ncbi:uncharacterized protein LOC109845776 [Asparagus officinalis]|uniref:uncharacterized protein LOC109845776 n=1 Tax=Asparagus officinalis TaxID=4686 RepID=UPI00098E3640|nr:uncharacterized protein LOC109845776 [Asparagus officinalis]